MFPDLPTMALLIPIVFWVAIVLIVFIAVYFGHRAKMARYKLLETMAEKGQPISSDVLASLGDSRQKPKGGIAGGIFQMCIGVALAIFFWGLGHFQNPFDGGSWLVVIGIFPFMVGLARVLACVFDKRDPNS